MNPETTSEIRKRHRFGSLLFLSFLIFLLGFVIEQTLQWSNRLHGLLSGLMQGGMLGLAWCVIYVLPWTLILFGLYHWRGWWRYRTAWALAPSVLVAVVMVGSLGFHPPVPHKRFKRFAKIELPSDAENLHAHFMGGGFADYIDTYYFKTRPSEVDRMIRELRLEPDRFFAAEKSHSIVKPLPGCPDFSKWNGAVQYKGWDQRQHWFYYLIVDSSKTQVYVVIGCI